MNPQLYQAMMQAQDPQQAMVQQAAYYHPAQIQSGGQGGQFGMSTSQMQQDIMARKMRDAEQVANIQRDGMAPV